MWQGNQERQDVCWQALVLCLFHHLQQLSSQPVRKVARTFYGNTKHIKELGCIFMPSGLVATGLNCVSTATLQPAIGARQRWDLTGILWFAPKLVRLGFVFFVVGLCTVCCLND